MPSQERAIRDFRADLVTALNWTLAKAEKEYRCEYEYPSTVIGVEHHPACMSRDAVVLCVECGRKMCKEHAIECCGWKYCQSCVEDHWRDTRECFGIIL
jgi:hypothetical protein